MWPSTSPGWILRSAMTADPRIRPAGSTAGPAPCTGASGRRRRNTGAPAGPHEAYRGESAGPADVGLTLSKRRGYIVVVSAAQGSPAADAGMQTGDVLVVIDGRSTRQMGVWEASQALRGRPGSKTTLNLSPIDSVG